MQLKKLQIGSRGANREFLKNVRDVAMSTADLTVSPVEHGTFTVSGPDDIVEGFYTEVQGEHGVWIRESTVTEMPADEPPPPAAA